MGQPKRCKICYTELSSEQEYLNSLEYGQRCLRCTDFFDYTEIEEYDYPDSPTN